MSTRANIILKDKYQKLWFYRHADGYPEGAMPTLEKFIKLLKEDRIRDNVSQASGWLVMLGAEEYNQSVENLQNSDNYNSWKVGAIEPTTEIHGDTEFLYTIDLETKTIKTEEIQRNWDTGGVKFKELK